MISLISAEMLKIRKRRASWIMFGILLAFLAFFLMGIRPIIAADDGRNSVEFQLANLVMRFPAGFGILVRMVSEMGQFILIVFAGLVVGSEYGWGTVRQVMARGASRNRYLAAKLAAILVSIVMGIILAMIVGTGFMLIGDVLVDSFDPKIPAGFAGDLAGDTLRTLGVLVVFAGLAFCIAILTRSVAGGLGLGLGWIFVEIICTGIFPLFGRIWRDISGYFLTNLSSSLMAANQLDVGQFFGDGGGGGDDGGPGGGGGRPVFDVEPLTAGLLLALYLVILLAISVWVFNRRDITAGG
jgi:ABC-2 type transport system permease protein